jgi:2-(1,2-epoxy-1,2-dihydrophenyl)acetyl-CoA isomerase
VTATLLRDRVRLELAGAVARVVLARPQTGNAVDLETASALQEAGERLQAAPGLRVVRIEAEGKAFCVGGDLRDFAGADDPGAHIAATADAAHRGLTALRELPVPLVGVVHGVAAGAGIGIALVADVVLAARSARFVVAYTAAGLSPDCGVSWHLARALGPARAADLLLTNRALSAEDAERWGLVSRVVDDADLARTADDVVARLASASTGALVEARRLARAAVTRDWSDHLADEAATIARLAGTPDGREGVRAFLDKRQPAFDGAPS